MSVRRASNAARSQSTASFRPQTMLSVRWSPSFRQMATTPPRNIVGTALMSVTLITSAAALYYWQSRPTNPDPITGKAQGDTFDIKLRTSNGVQTFSFPRKFEAEVENMLHVNETSERIGRKGNPVVRWDRNWLGSNEPCEDRSVIDLIPRSTKNQEEGKRDLMMFSVLDGHAGDATSKLLTKALHPTIALGLAALQAGHVPGVATGGLRGLAEYVIPKSWFGNVWTPENVAASIRDS